MATRRWTCKTTSEHTVVMMPERELDTFFEEVLNLQRRLRLRRVKVDSCHRVIAGKQLAKHLGYELVGMQEVVFYRFEDPALGGTWLFWWEETGMPRRTELGRRRLRRIIETYWVTLPKEEREKYE